MLFVLFTILPFTACLFWMTVLLLDWRRDNPAQHVLAAFMAVGALLYLCHAVFFNHEDSLHAITECLYAFCNIAVFPLYYLYISRLTDRGALTPKHFAILFPALIIGVWTTILYFCCPENIHAENVRLLVMRLVFMVQLVPICWVSYRRLKSFDREIANYYADTESRTVRPTLVMMWLLIAAALFSGASNFLGREYFDSPQLILAIPSILFTLLLFGVGYVGMRQEFCIDDLLRDESSHDNLFANDDSNPPENSTSNPVKDIPVEDAMPKSQIIAQLDALMAESKIYLRHDLRLSEVASMLGVGRTTLSQRINQELNLSFSDYINNLRVDYACQLISNPESIKMSLNGVAEMSGFSSDSSFYRAFRRYKGMTPKQYMSKNPH